jgi:hypothetical protein
MKIRRRFWVIFILQLGYFTGICQQENSPSQKLRATVVGSMGVSYFSSRGSESQARYPTNDPKLGVRLNYLIFDRIELNTSLNFGCKIKGQRVYPPGTIVGGLPVRLPSPNNMLEEAVNSDNHFYIEVPLGLSVNIYSKWQVGVGVSTRNFMGNNGNEFTTGGDFFSNRFDWGPLGTITYSISKSVRLMSTYYFGITRIYSVAGEINGAPVNFDVRNRAFHIGLEIFFRDGVRGD